MVKMARDCCDMLARLNPAEDSGNNLFMGG